MRRQGFGFGELVEGLVWHSLIGKGMSQNELGLRGPEHKKKAGPFPGGREADRHMDAGGASG